MGISKELEARILGILKDCNLSAHTDIACVSLLKNTDSAQKLKEFIKNLNDSSDAIVSSMGKTAITILIHEKYLEAFENFFKKNIQSVNKKAGAIFMKCPKEVNNTPGVTAIVSSFFADKNVAIHELMASY